MVCALASGRSVTWWEYRTPRSPAPARSAPHAQAIKGFMDEAASKFPDMKQVASEYDNGDALVRECPLEERLGPGLDPEGA